MFCPKAKYDDKLVDVCTVGNLSKLKILMLLPTAFIGKHIHFKGVYSNRCKELEVHTRQPQHVHCDGESLGICHSLKVIMNAAQIPVITE